MTNTILPIIQTACPRLGGNYTLFSFFLYTKKDDEIHINFLFFICPKGFIPCPKGFIPCPKGESNPHFLSESGF